MTVFIPIIDLTYKGSIRVWKKQETPYVVVRLSDLTIKGSNKPNKTYEVVMAAGGLHSYLDYNGIIIFSIIMPDKQIAQFIPPDYAYYINSLEPDYYFTVDGWTYDKNINESENELRRTYYETKELISLVNKPIKPIGIVKGCTESQIDAHSSLLMSLGIRDFVFHIGDYRRNGQKYYMNKGKHFAKIIRKKARTLLLYGFGSQKELNTHSFADAYMSYNHFVTADNGMEYNGVNKVRSHETSFEKRMEKNYLQMHKNMDLMKYQKTFNEVNLSLWAAEKQESKCILNQVRVNQFIIEA